MNTFDHGLLPQQFVNGLPDCAVTLLDVDGNVLTWNDGARAVLGYVVYEIVGRNYSCLYTKDDISTGKPSTSLAAAARAQGPYEERARRVRKDGTEFEAQSVLIPLYDQQKNLVGFGNMIR